MTQSKKSPARKLPVKNKKPRIRGTKIETRGKILAAARHVFSNHPYHSATIRMIGKLAEIEHPLISYYFPNKAELFISVLEEFVGRQAQMERQWLEEVKSMTPARGFAVFLDFRLDYFRLHPEEFRIFALNMVQSEDTEPIPGYDLIQRAINESVKNFIEIVPLSAPDYEVDMFCRVMLNCMVNFLGASNFHASLMKLDPNSIQYLNWVKDTTLYTLLPRFEMMVKQSGSDTG